MNNEVEELFAELLKLPQAQRKGYLSKVESTEDEKAAALRLLTAFESKSEFLNDDLLTDLANLDPDFFVSGSEQETVLKTGQRVGSYVVQESCGEGGMSIVYRATQSEPIKRQVALKLIRPSLFGPKAILRFFREQQALALVNHPNIATLYDVGTTPAGHPYAAMEFVDGKPITEFCKLQSFDSEAKIELFVKACQGLAEAHRHGIIHRDIKPDNILVAERAGVGYPKLIDFGIVKFFRPDMEANKTMTQAGQVLGSPRYMSPEQIEGKSVDQRSDVYSAGLVLFELLTLSPYRKGDTAEMMLTNSRTEVELLSDRLRSPNTNAHEELSRSELKSLLKWVHRDLNWILAKALARNPDERYPNVPSLVEDLTASKQRQPISVSKPGWLQRSARVAKSNQGPIAAAVALAMLVMCGLFFLNWRSSAQELSQFKADTKQQISEVKRQSDEELTIAKQESQDRLLEVERRQKEKLESIRKTSLVNEKRNAASNELILRLFASGDHQLTSEHLDMGSIRMYQDQFEQIRFQGGPKNHEEKTVYGILAVFYAMSGKFDEADQLMEEVVDVQRRSELQKVRIRICENYSANAKTKLASLPAGDRSLERASQQLVLGRCYIVLDMLGEAERLIAEAIEIYDEDSQSACEALVARNTLAKVYQLAKRNQALKDLLDLTYQTYKNDDELLDTKRGHSAFAQTNRMISIVKERESGGVGQ
jgi:serine/threonine protein kinase